VRFKGESSIGSAILREWMDLVGADAFCNPKNHLLLSYDRGQSYMFDPVAPYINPKWQHDYELLGRLIGLALYHQVLYPEHHARSMQAVVFQPRGGGAGEAGRAGDGGCGCVPTQRQVVRGTQSLPGVCESNGFGGNNQRWCRARLWARTACTCTAAYYQGAY
jgi:hypothetical protein